MSIKSYRFSRLIYTLSLLYILCGRIIPLRFWLFLGRAFGLLFYFLDRKHREIAFSNLRFAFGNTKTEREIQAIARKTFEEFGMISHEWIKLRKMQIEELAELILVEGAGYLRAAKEKSEAVILLGAHFGNWEYAHLFYASTINPLNFIVRAIENPFLESERVAYNTHFGVRILYKENGLRPAIRNLKKGEDLVIFADQKVNLQEGILCRFFGKTTSTLAIVPFLALKYHVPVVPMFIVRCKDRVHHRLIFLPELVIESSGKEEAILKATQQQNNVIEAIIRAYPQQWLWFHRKWSYHYPEIYKF
jgi:KDO2-lipid IV(A) lauroyltransferase